ncbi:MAG: hypothetical protein WCQ50_11855 [Spirochaetota bacterium]
MSLASSPLCKGPLPVDIVFHPSWWHHNAGISFDEDFFYHPAKRVESERLMEEVLYDRFGDCGLGGDHGVDRPVIGAVHLAAGYIVSEMLGCEVAYAEDAAPQVRCAQRDNLSIDADAAASSPAWKRLDGLADSLKSRFGYLTGDINWGGVLNAAIDLRGQELFLDMTDRPGEVKSFFSGIAAFIETFTRRIEGATGTSSISVNRNLVNLDAPVFLHSECSHTMISVADYEEYLLGYDIAFSGSHRPFGIHFCGKDPHRFADSFAKIPRLDFLDLGWGGDVAALRKRLPDTFFNIRLDPVQIAAWSTHEIARTVSRLVGESGNPWLTGVCCTNMDEKVPDGNVRTIFQTVFELRERARVDPAPS